MYFDDNPSHDLMSFDNVGVAFVSLLQAITFDGWTLSLYGLEAVLASSSMAVLFFVLAVTVGGFFLVNLFHICEVDFTSLPLFFVLRAEAKSRVAKIHEVVFAFVTTHGTSGRPLAVMSHMTNRH